MTACPFGIPTFQWESPTPWIRKCTFCANRQKQGLQPACSGTCPTGALKFGRREDLIIEAKSRISTNPGMYVDHVYGETEIGGTSWLYIAAVPFEMLGLRKLQTESVTVNVKRAMNFVPPVLVGMAAAMTGIYFIAKRREKNRGNTVNK
jgi:formate dehydrogenase iron-sulfur subunit